MVQGRRILLAAVVALCLLPAWGQHKRDEPGVAPEKVNTEPEVEDLGDGRFRIGSIELDKDAGEFQIPGRILRDEPPLEFLVVIKDGFKAYESLLEVDATAYEFNVACILIGLNPKHGVVPEMHFDPQPVKGDPVDIWVAWELDGKPFRRHAADLIRMGDETLARRQWVYIGSGFTPFGEYLAQVDGTLVGFVHDPSSIIEHRTGLGLKDFGAVEPNRSLTPPVGTPIKFIVKRRG